MILALNAELLSSKLNNPGISLFDILDWNNNQNPNVRYWDYFYHDRTMA
jgi:hypothetical protein